MNAPRAVANLGCPECLGAGVLRDQQQRNVRCPRCQGMGAVGVVDGELIRYGEAFSRASLRLERLHALVRAIVDGVFVLFGLAGLVVAVREFMDVGTVFTGYRDVLFRQSPGMAFFWLSLLGDLYVYYRLDTESAQPRRLSVQRVLLERPPESFVDIGTAAVLDIAPTFSRRARHDIKLAWEMADRLGHRFVDDRHVFSALLAEHDVAVALIRLGVPQRAIMERAAHLLWDADRGGPTVIGRAAHEVFFRAYAEARHHNGQAIEPLDLLIALGGSEGRVRDLLDDVGIDERKLRNVVQWGHIQEELRRRWGSFRAHASRKPKGVMDRAMLAQATPVLNQFSHDLTALARAGATHLVVGRADETNTVFRALEGKANAVLVGHPGVGKTAIIEGIANRMVEEDVPPVLQDKRLVSLSVPALVSGAGGMGSLEERFTEIIDEVVKAGNIVLFIDNLQNLVGVGSTGGKTMDLSGILAQALASRRFFVIATTNFGDYSQYIERSGSLASAFEKVEVGEMSKDDTILVLESKAGGIEYQHKVFFSYAAIEKTVEMAGRYIHERFEPRKSMDLLEEVAISAHRRKGKGVLVTGEDVARVVSEKTHVAVTEVTEKESEKLLHLEEKIHGRVIGQEEAVKAVSSALRRARAELRDPNRPIATFLFLGPTGVGKTELAKTVAEAYFGSEKNMIRLDMSEYQDPASLYRMIGAPPGYGGGEGYLTEGIRRNPFTIILLDELEKAHADVLNIFLQVMDDGRLTDSNGRTADFTNAIIIATSNAGTPLIQEGIRNGVPLAEIKNVLINKALGQYYRPEFLNRFDDIIVFKPLNEKEIEQIAGILLGHVAKNLAARGITLRATPEAIAALGRSGFDPVFGARPLRRAIQEHVDDALANFLLKGKLGRRDVAVLEPGGTIRVEKARAV